MQQKAILIGASGLIGNHLLQKLLYDVDFSNVKVLVRKKLAIEHPKLTQVIIDFNLKHEYDEMGTGDVIFCCIGTTQAKVKGDKRAYEKIDVEIPVNAAETAATNGFKKFLIVSSVGADVQSSNFYLHIKGKMENAIKQFAIPSISIFRPSMLIGKRNESRPLEKIGQSIMGMLSFLFVGKIKKYHPVHAEEVAMAMIIQSKKDEAGIKILAFSEIKKLLENQ